MAVPSFEALMLPALSVLADGAVLRPREVDEAVAAQLGVSPGEQGERPTGETGKGTNDAKPTSHQGAPRSLRARGCALHNPGKGSTGTPEGSRVNQGARSQRPSSRIKSMPRAAVQRLMRPQCYSRKAQHVLCPRLGPDESQEFQTPAPREELGWHASRAYNLPSKMCPPSNIFKAPPRSYQGGTE